MTPELQDLGRRAVACKGWRWMEGMLTDNGARILEVRDDALILWQGGTSVWIAAPGLEEWPDFSDAATLGCLLALVREVTKDPGFFVFKQDDGEWRAVGLNKPGRWSRVVDIIESTEERALVAALEAVSNED